MKLENRFLTASLTLLVGCSLGFDEDKYVATEGIKKAQSFVVTLEDSTKAQELLAMENVSSFSEVADGVFVVQANEDELAQLFENSDVAKIYEDALLPPLQPLMANLGVGAPSWHLDRIDQSAPALDGAPYTPRYDGQGVSVYVLDTGVLTTHTGFEGRARFGVNTATGDSSPCESHGTAVSGLVASRQFGSAPGANIVDVNIYDCDLDEDGDGIQDGAFLSDTLEGIEWIKDNAIFPAVANISQGVEGQPTSAVLNQAIRELADSGVLVVVSSGNEFVDACTRTFASSPFAITSGAVDISGQRYGNFGSCVDVWAPGVLVSSTSGSGNTTTLTGTGTSFAAPLVSGAVAMLLEENPALGRIEAEAILRQRATLGQIQDLGVGSPDGLLWVESQADAVAEPSCQAAGPLDSQGNDADGFGWDGTSSCRLDGAQTSPPAEQPSGNTGSPGECDYSSASSNGGWGWNASTGQSCPPLGAGSSNNGQDAESENGVGTSCDYSSASANGGWGWDPVNRVSCPPL